MIVIYAAAAAAAADDDDDDDVTHEVTHPVLCASNEWVERLSMFLKRWWLTLKHRETHGCLVSTVATDALVLKHQAISIHNAD